MRLVQLYQPAVGAEWEASPFVQFEGHDRSEVAGPTFTPDGAAST